MFKDVNAANSIESVVRKRPGKLTKVMDDIDAYSGPDVEIDRTRHWRSTTSEVKHVLDGGQTA
jgi:hypothetical protein